MAAQGEAFDRIAHDVDVCVVGGGMAGLCTALAAARAGATVALMHDRPVLGGNASSEIRVHVCGADRFNSIANMRETGILEQLRLTNLRRNPNRVYSVWDTVLYEAARFQDRLTLLLNCSCLDAEMAGDRIVRVTGWQLTTQTWQTVSAKIFVDCSGDAVLAPLTGAQFRVGHEARSEYGESVAPEVADRRTMGMTCLFQSRLHETPQPFEPPAWAYRFDRCEDLPYGRDGHRWWEMGYWWIELGGEDDSIADTEVLRDELLRITYGVWDHIKNRCRRRDEAAHWALEWVQFLPGKRESRRYVGDHVLTQVDIEAEGKFEDRVAYGGWTMDDHHSAGFRAVRIGAPATMFHPAPSPYGIPYRCLYSRNIANLMFAGRCHSATHAAMSSTRVMGTGCSMGEAVGRAAAMAVRLGIDPRGVNDHIAELQQALLHGDCYVPWVRQAFGPLTATARLETSRGDGEPVRDGISRPVGDDLHAWTHRPGETIAYRFDGARDVRQATVVLDSALDQNIQMSHHGGGARLLTPPAALCRGLRVEVLNDGQWRPHGGVADNHQRLVRLPIEARCEGVRVVPEQTWGADESRLYAFYLD